jgi:AcrR family transcriptional regulator
MVSGTKKRLIETAERLFAQRGIAGVSLREIGEAAGQRNTAAVLYHFGSKQRLIEAILQHRTREHEARRVVVASEVKRPGRAGRLRAAVEGMVRPLAEALHPGSYAVRFLAQLLTDPVDRRSLLLVQEIVASRMAAHLRTTLRELPHATLRRRVRFAWRFLIDTLAGHEHELEVRRRPSINTTDLARELVELIVAMISAPTPTVGKRSARRPVGVPPARRTRVPTHQGTAA